MVVNGFDTWCWRKILKIKWRDRITNDEVVQKGERRQITFKKLKKQTPLMNRAYN
jgi:hypothetical protein